MLAEVAEPDQRAAKKMRLGHCTKKKNPSRCHSDMCIPVHVVFVNFANHPARGLQMIQDYEQHYRQKSNDSRQNNRKAVSGEFDFFVGRNVDANIRSLSPPYPTLL